MATGSAQHVEIASVGCQYLPCALGFGQPDQGCISKINVVLGEARDHVANGCQVADPMGRKRMAPRSIH